MGESVVRIQPIVARLPGGEAMQEAGIGGGGEDLEPEVELGVASPGDLSLLLEMSVICPYSLRTDADQLSGSAHRPHHRVI